MHRPLIYRIVLFAVLGGLTACATAPVNKAQPLGMTSVRAADEPCWIRTPDCLAEPDDAALYFVGQNARPVANWGRPTRDAFHSAQQDAEQQYAHFLGVEVESSSYLESLFEGERYQSHVQHTLKQSVRRKVSELLKADEYFVAYQQTTEGEPIWTVYVLIKIDQAHVQKHRQAIAREAQLKAAPPPKVDAAPTPDEWVASVFNLDDGVAIYVNGTKINQCGFSESCEVRLTPHFHPGPNTVRLEYMNRAVFWTYGYEILRNGELMYRDRCGQVWLYGCSWDRTVGVVHRFEFQVDFRPPSPTGKPASAAPR